MVIASRFTTAKIPIIGSEKKKTDVAPGADAPRNTSATMASSTHGVPSGCP